MMESFDKSYDTVNLSTESRLLVAMNKLDDVQEDINTIAAAVAGIEKYLKGLVDENQKMKEDIALKNRQYQLLEIRYRRVLDTISEYEKGDLK